jgi:prophage regulatory protein
MRHLRLAEVLDLIPVSRATLYRWIADDLFPRPRQLGPNVVAWPEESVQEFLNSRPEAERRSEIAEEQA